MRTKSPPWLKPLVKYSFTKSSNALEVLTKITANTDIIRLPTVKKNYLINDPDAIYHVLLTNRNNYTKEGTSYERVRRLVGNGLLTTSGKDWETRRHNYQTAFQPKHLKRHFEIIRKYSERMLSDWDNLLKRPINVTDELLATTMNMSSEILLGIDLSDRSLDIVRWIHSIHTYAMRSKLLWKWTPTLPNINYQLSKKAIDNYLLTKLKEVDVAISHPLLESLLARDESGVFLASNQDILSEAKNFFIAGHETTGNGLSWMLYFLAKNNYVLAKVITEIDSVLGHGMLENDTLNDLPYLDLVINESLRLAPPIWVFMRRALQADTLLGYEIAPGSIIHMVPYLIHRHPKYWKQPDIFYPERFLPNADKKRPKCAYIPFGFGPRACIGRHMSLLMMKTILVMLLQRYTIELPQKNYEVPSLPLITLKPKGGVRLKISKR